MSVTRILAAGLVLGLGLAGPQVVAAQGHGQQGQQMMQQQQQQQMARMQQMMQRMNQIQDRIHHMDQSVTKQMDQLRARAQDRAQDGTGNGDQLRQQDRDRLMQHQQLHDMLQSTGDMVRQMSQSMEQLRRMSGEPGFAKDQVMNRNMEQLQERFRNMADQSEECVKLMEQIQQRLQEQNRTEASGTS